MFPLAKNALRRLQVRSIQQTMARQSHQKRAPDFHDKYGNAVLASGAIFCVAVWTYMLYWTEGYIKLGQQLGWDYIEDIIPQTATQIGIEWNLSPVGRVTPKEWRDQ